MCSYSAKCKIVDLRFNDSAFPLSSRISCHGHVRDTLHDYCQLQSLSATRSLHVCRSPLDYRTYKCVDLHGIIELIIGKGTCQN